MKDSKIPRKLKKMLKKHELNSHSKSFIKHYKIRLKDIRILYIDRKRDVYSSDFNRRK